MARTQESTNNSTASARATLRTHTDWKLAAWAGFLAGIVFVVMEMLLVWIFMGQSPWGPPRMIAAIVLGKQVLPPPASFDFAIVMVALIVHFLLSVVYGLILGWIVHGMDMGPALLAGAAFGLIAAYLVNFYLIAPMLFPWFTEARNWISILSHLVFGLVIAAVYVSSRDRAAT